jgi:glycosyltransferase involved in cell wall biosynthesis
VALTAGPIPFFEAPGGPSSTEGRILLLSYEFPPAGTAGARRWQKLTGHLAKHGWGFDVITAEPGTRGPSDMGRLDDLPGGTRVFGVPWKPLLIDALEARVYAAYRRMRDRTRAPGNGSVDGRPAAGVARARPRSLARHEIGFTPLTPRQAVRAYYATLLYFRERGWAVRAMRLGKQLVESLDYGAVISCGPPHIQHNPARLIARHAGIPFVMDMRDPWSQVERLMEVMASPLWLEMSARGERRAVRAASLVVCNTERARRTLAAVHPAASARIITVMNGFDEEPLPAPVDDGCFRIAYAGAIYLDRDPRGLFTAAGDVVRELSLAPDRFRIELMGKVQSYNDVSLETIARECGVERHLSLHPAGTRDDALRFLARAAVLVSLPQDSAMAIPSKVFEYMRYDAWLLALAEQDTATADLLRGSGTDVVTPDDRGGIARVLKERYLQYCAEGRPRQPALIPSCSRAAQADRLWSALGPLLTRASARGSRVTRA